MRLNRISSSLINQLKLKQKAAFNANKSFVCSCLSKTFYFKMIFFTCFPYLAVHMRTLVEFTEIHSFVAIDKYEELNTKFSTTI